MTLKDLKQGETKEEKNSIDEEEEKEIPEFTENEVQTVIYSLKKSQTKRQQRNPC